MKSNYLRNEFEELIGYRFTDHSLLQRAMVHSSYANEQHLKKYENNERLEFLGDAVLELTTSDYLFLQYPYMPEGDMTKLRASIVCEQTLALCANEIFLGKYLSLGKGEELTGGRERNSVLSDAMEAVIGAIYLDGGFTNAKEFIHKYILTELDKKQLFYDSKTILQEIVQAKYKEPLNYELVSEKGPDHDKQFVVRAMVGMQILGEGTGHTKKGAQQQAAYYAILKLKQGE